MTNIFVFQLEMGGCFDCVQQGVDAIKAGEIGKLGLDSFLLQHFMDRIEYPYSTSIYRPQSSWITAGKFKNQYSRDDFKFAPQIKLLFSTNIFE